MNCYEHVPFDASDSKVVCNLSKISANIKFPENLTLSRISSFIHLKFKWVFSRCQNVTSSVSSSFIHSGRVWCIQNTKV